MEFDLSSYDKTIKTNEPLCTQILATSNFYKILMQTFSSIVAQQ